MTTGQKNGMTIGLKRVVHLNAHDMHEINARFCEVYYMSRLSVILGQVRAGNLAGWWWWSRGREWLGMILP